MKCLNFTTSFLFRAFCVIFMLFSTITLYAQQALRGVVHTKQDKPIAGATIKVKNTNQISFSSANGEFTINEEKFPFELEVSYLGYNSQTLSVSDSKFLTIKLDEADNEIDEVMVVAYGTQKKSTMVGSVAQISSSEIKKAPAMNITNTLAGRLPGLTTLQQSGRPGADGASLYVRGIGTYGSNRGPLVIVDDIERPSSTLAYLDPNEIESISVLKDAVATAAYGVQAANGIIIVKTKSGTKGKPKVSYDFSYNIGENTRFPKFLDGPDYMAWYNKGTEVDNDILINTGAAPVAFVFSQEMIDAVRNGTNDNPLLGNTDWMGILAGNNSYSQHHAATINGGAENTQYFASINHLNQDGVINHTNFKRYNVRTNINTKVTDYLKLGLNVGLRNQETNTPGISPDNTAYMNPFYQATRMLPNLPMFAPTGEYTSSRNGAGLMSPIASVEESGYQKYLMNIFQGTANLEFFVPGVKGLTAKLQGAYDYQAQEGKTWTQPYTTMMRDQEQVTGNYVAQYVVPGISKTTLRQSHSANYSRTLQGSLNYSNTFNDHSVGGLFLYEFYKGTGNVFAAGASNFPITVIHEINYGSKEDDDIIASTGSSTPEITRAGVVAKFNYGFRDKYLFEAAARWDASSNFAKQNRWKIFPGAGLGWVISKEDFFQDFVDNESIDFLKFKTSFGRTGNDRANAGLFSYMQTFAQQTAPGLVIGGQPIAAVYSANIPNPDLKWEESQMFNIGFESRLFENFGFDFEWFYRYTYDILDGIGGLYPASIGGYHASLANIGTMDNRGFDAQLRYNNTFGDFKLGLTGNVNWSRNRYLKYQEADGTPAHLSVIGRSVGAKTGYVADGFIETWEEAKNTSSPSTGIIAPGFFRFKDLDGDGRITAYGDRTFIGRSNIPELMFGLNIDLAYKGFDFSALLQGAALADVSLAGGYEGAIGVSGVHDNTVWTKTFYGSGNSPYFLMENAWRPDNMNAEYPRLTANKVGVSPHNANGNSGWLRKGDYLRLKSVQLGYTLPKSLLDKAKMDNVRLFVTGSNLFTWDHLKFIDPEMPNVNLGFYPQQRIYAFGLSVTF